MTHFLSQIQIKFSLVRAYVNNIIKFADFIQRETFISLSIYAPNWMSSGKRKILSTVYFRFRWSEWGRDINEKITNLQICDETFRKWRHRLTFFFLLNKTCTSFRNFLFILLYWKLFISSLIIPSNYTTARCFHEYKIEIDVERTNECSNSTWFVGVSLAFRQHSPNVFRWNSNFRQMEFPIEVDEWW